MPKGKDVSLLSRKIKGVYALTQMILTSVIFTWILWHHCKVAR